MEKSRIIAEIDAEISRLQQAKALLSGTTESKRGPGRPPKSDTPKPAKKAVKKRVLSAEARAKIADAQKARWAKAKKSVK